MTNWQLVGLAPGSFTNGIKAQLDLHRESHLLNSYEPPLGSHVSDQSLYRAKCYTGHQWKVDGPWRNKDVALRLEDCNTLVCPSSGDSMNFD